MVNTKMSHVQQILQMEDDCLAQAALVHKLKEEHADKALIKATVNELVRLKQELYEYTRSLHPLVSTQIVNTG